MSFPPNIHENAVDSLNERIRYFDSVDHNEADTPVVLLHGTGGSSKDSFWALFPMLAMRRRVIALDFVDPDGPASEDNLDSYVQQAIAVIEKASPDRSVHLVGYSFGAVVAAILAARRPHLVDGLVLVAGWVTTTRHQQLRNDVWRALHTSRSPFLADFTVLTAFSSDYLSSRSDQEFAELIHKAANGTDRSLKMRLNRSVDISALIGEIGAPTIVIAGSTDVMVPLRQSHLLFAGIPNARLAMVESGHAIVHERPAELASLIERFLSRTDATPPGSVIQTLDA